MQSLVIFPEKILRTAKTLRCRLFNHKIVFLGHLGYWILLKYSSCPWSNFFNFLSPRLCLRYPRPYHKLTKNHTSFFMNSCRKSNPPIGYRLLSYRFSCRRCCHYYRLRLHHLTEQLDKIYTDVLVHSVIGGCGGSKSVCYISRYHTISCRLASFVIWLSLLSLVFILCNCTIPDSWWHEELCYRTLRK